MAARKENIFRQNREAKCLICGKRMRRNGLANHLRDTKYHGAVAPEATAVVESKRS